MHRQVSLVDVFSQEISRIVYQLLMVFLFIGNSL